MAQFIDTYRADSSFAASQQEMSPQSNAISHWLGANLERALYIYEPWKCEKKITPCLIRWFMMSVQICYNGTKYIAQIFK